MQLDVFPLPELAPRSGYDVFVCIDVLRATTTITTALYHGATWVTPLATVEETLAARERLLEETPDLKGRILLGGERKGEKIPEFDLANSPDAYTEEVVKDKIFLFTTTNGTKAILHGQKEKGRKGDVLLASFVNAQAIVQSLLERSYDKIAILCAGTGGEYTEEDLLLAGCLVDRFCQAQWRMGIPRTMIQKNIQAEEVQERWRSFLLKMKKSIKEKTINEQGQSPALSMDLANEKKNESADSCSLSPLISKVEDIGEISCMFLAEELEQSHGGRNLLRIHLKKDIADAAKLDSISLVPEYKHGRITGRITEN